MRCIRTVLSCLAACLFGAAVGCASRPAPAPASASAEAPADKVRWGLAVHGGAGTITRENLTPQKEAAVRAALEAALREGHAVLAKGGSSLDAVSAAVVVLEDSPHFNAGKGAVFTSDGRNELDAAIMHGPTLNAGAVAGLHRVKNPILLARAVMERSAHVMMIGEGAERFAVEAGMQLVDPSWFFTEHRWEQLQQKKREEADAGTSSALPAPEDSKFGTVGAVALDQQGALSAGTSTGGLTNKRYGRVGDVPIIGAGTYASSGCAVSATGKGEVFIRYTAAHELCARMKYRGTPLSEAAREVVMDELGPAGGEGGVIAMDANGNVALTFNSAGMYRGYIGEDGVPHVAIYRD